MKERIENMIALLESERYDPEGAHVDYDSLLEEFILNFDINLLEQMKKLISIDKEFWYA